MIEQGYNIIINSSNVIGNNNNTFQYNFIQGSLKILPNSEICITQATIPYSWFNVSATYYANATFQYTWTVGTTTTTYTITLPNGFYLVSDIQNYLQNVFITNGHYLIDSNSNYIFYIMLSTNSNYYTTSLVSYAVPTSLPVGWSQPSNFAGYPTTASTPQLIITLPNFGTLLGFVPGTYPPTIQSTNYNTIGTITPNGSPVNSVVFSCDLVNNPVITPNDLLDSMSINTTFGSNINYTPNFEKYVQIRPGSYSSLTLRLLDQNLTPIISNDSNILINLRIRTKF